MSQTPDIDELTPTTAITILLGGAETTNESKVLMRVGARVGFLWQCVACREASYLERTACSHCGAPRPGAAATD
ncbi:zinc finger Ran-binding domain-containing protein [Streptomyces sp. G1]|uniref:zinc finger Ran-binding domain-containing protein n=1 Tax=Streptomyces sp. G1 TaxID=361572 RepID=UPI00202F4443|nr:zinc finger Ran-binding domain-containing protein [Streptomyces sp. G1]MCM1964896.1 zinc finger Ran-binding domain-containing protein [Streptomyces sp. G1]